jgi:hypothetical protein
LAERCLAAVVDHSGRLFGRTVDDGHGSAGEDWDHVTALPAYGRNPMANLTPSGIQGEVAKQR